MSPCHSQTARIPTRLGRMQGEAAWPCLASHRLQPCSSQRWERQKGRGVAPATSRQERAEGTAPRRASATGGQLQAGQERARRGLVPLLFSQNKGNSLALLEVACSGCASLLSSDNLATWELPCSSPVEPALRDANSFRMSCPLQRSVFRSPGWGGTVVGAAMMALAGPRLTMCHMPGRRSAPAGDDGW